MLKSIVKKTPLLICGAMLLGLLGGCGGGTDPTTKESPSEAKEKQASGGKVVTVAIASDNGISTMDATYAMTDILHYELIYEPLVVFGKDGKIEPCLAESWDFSEDGKEYTFHLRKGVKFSDGTDFNADNVIFNTDRWAENSNTASTAVCKGLQTVEKIDDYTVKFVFDKSFYPYLTELSYPRPCRMMGKDSIDANGKFVKPIGTGMWMIESYQDGKETVLVPNPYYWGEKPKIDKLIIKVIPDSEARVMALQSGEIDFCAAPIPTESMYVIENDSKLSLVSRKGTLGYHMIFNYDVPALQELKIRQAINCAIDKNSIVDNILDGNGTPAAGLFPETVPYVNSKNNLGYSYDIEKAKTLLSEAGCKDSDGDGILEYKGKPLSFKFVFQTDQYPEWKNVCEYIKAELQDVGIDIKLELQPSAQYYDTLWTSRDFDMVMYRTYSDSWNPHGFLRGMYCKASDEAVRVAWNSDELSEMIDSVLQEVDETARQEKYSDIFEYIYENAIAAPIYYPNGFYAYNKSKITGVEFAVTEYELIKWAKIDTIN